MSSLKPELQTLDIRMNGILVGKWRQYSNNAQAFQYVPSWLESPYARPISLSLPLQFGDEWVSNHNVVNYFENLLPDNREVLDQIKRKKKVLSDSAFDILMVIGKDAVGAVQILEEGQTPGEIRAIDVKQASPPELASIIRNAASAAGTESNPDFRISLAGAQEKTGFTLHNGAWMIPGNATPTTHIFKRALKARNHEFPDAIESEWICSKLAAAFGLEVAPTQIDTFDGEKVIIVERFDRKLSDDGTHWLRLPQEDMCQAKGLPSARKYQSDGGPSAADIMALLNLSADPGADRVTFFKAFVFNWLVANTDAHAKNFSLHIQSNGRIRLAPLYDIVSMWPYSTLNNPRGVIPLQDMKMAMQFGGSYHWDNYGNAGKRLRQLAKECGLSARLTHQIIRNMCNDAPRALDTVKKDMHSELEREVFGYIDKGVRKAVTILTKPSAGNAAMQPFVRGRPA